MTVDYASNEERDFYVSQGRKLAHELGASETAVVDAFEAEVQRMLHEARIKDFISVIAAKLVREQFRVRG